MRRTYFTSPKRQEITDQAMQELRRTRSRVDPALLERVRDLFTPSAIPESWLSMIRPSAPSHEPVDRRKMLAIVAKVMEAQPHNARLKVLMSDFLSD